MGAYKRGNSWVISYSVNGKRKRETIGPSKREAELVLAKRRAAVREGQFFDLKKGGNAIFREVADRFMREHAERHMTDKSITVEKSRLKRLNEKFGDWKLREIDSDAVSSFLKLLSDEGKSKATLNRYRGLLGSIFSMAVRWRLMGSNPVRLVKPVRETNQRDRFLIPGEVAALLRECPPWLRPIVQTAVNTGMRREEILSLTWDRVNTQHRTIHLTKTKNGHARVVPVNEELWKVLSSLPRHLHSPYVFAKKDGARYHPDGLKKAFSGALKRAGIEDFRFHDLRHCAASILVMAGVDLFTVSQLLGHRTLAMTKRYAHLAPSHLSDAAQALGRALREGQEGRERGTGSRA